MITQQALLSSKALVRSNSDLPRLQAIEVEFTPPHQKLESFFSDSLHLVSVTCGQLPANIVESQGSKPATRLVKKLAVGQAKPVLKGLSNFALEGSLVSFQGSDVGSAVVSVDTTRTFLSSPLENDLKYRMSVHEFYMDRAAVKVKFVFNVTSVKQVRGREALLRLYNLPVRLVKRLVNV